MYIGRCLRVLVCWGGYDSVEASEDSLSSAALRVRLRERTGGIPAGLSARGVQQQGAVDSDQASEDLPS